MEALQTYPEYNVHVDNFNHLAKELPTIIMPKGVTSITFPAFITRVVINMTKRLTKLKEQRLEVQALLESLNA